MLPQEVDCDSKSLHFKGENALGIFLAQHSSPEAQPIIFLALLPTAQVTQWVPYALLLSVWQDVSGHSLSQSGLTTQL